MPNSRYAQVSLEATPYYTCPVFLVVFAGPFFRGTDQTSGRRAEYGSAKIADKYIEEWCLRLMNISWFMRIF